jgi:hypothetical protein
MIARVFLSVVTVVEIWLARIERAFLDLAEMETRY